MKLIYTFRIAPPLDLFWTDFFGQIFFLCRNVNSHNNISVTDLAPIFCLGGKLFFAKAFSHDLNQQTPNTTVLDHPTYVAQPLLGRNSKKHRNSILRKLSTFYLLFSLPPHRQIWRRTAPTRDIFRAIEKSTLEILISCHFVD